MNASQIEIQTQEERQAVVVSTLFLHSQDDRASNCESQKLKSQSWNLAEQTLVTYEHAVTFVLYQKTHSPIKIAPIARPAFLRVRQFFVENKTKGES